ncbi:MAG: PaaI family thioesterase [Parvularculales bacterium]
MRFDPINPNYEDDTRQSFTHMTALATLGMELNGIAPGQIELLLVKHKSYTQQMGFLHGGILTTGLDGACGLAAMTLTPKSNEIMTIELKTTFLAPASQVSILFIGTVTKPGRRIVFTDGEAFGLDGDDRVLLAKMSATMYCKEAL